MFWVKMKRFWLSLYINFMAVLMSICSVFQYIRRLLSQLLLVPLVVLVIMAVGTCALLLIGAFMMEGTLLANLGQMGIMCAAVIVIFFLAKLVLFAVSFALEGVLAIFDLQRPIRKMAMWMESALESYVFTIDRAPMSKAGYRALFFLPNLLQKIGDGLEWLLDRAGILIYPLSAIGGVMICRSWYLETWDSGWGSADYIVSVIMSLIVIGLSFSMDLTKYLSIIEIADSGSFSQAARNLYISQPNLSSQVKKLEALLGYPIFERTRSGAIPTKERMQLIERMRIAKREAWSG